MLVGVSIGYVDIEGVLLRYGVCVCVLCVCVCVCVCACVCVCCVPG